MAVHLSSRWREAVLGRWLGWLDAFRRLNCRSELAHALPPRDLLFAEPVETGRVTTCLGHTDSPLTTGGPGEERCGD